MAYTGKHEALAESTPQIIAARRTSGGGVATAVCRRVEDRGAAGVQMSHTGRELTPAGEICRNVCRPQEMERNNSPQQRRRRVRFELQVTAGWAIAAQQQIKCGEFRHPTQVAQKTQFWFQEDRNGSKKQRVEGAGHTRAGWSGGDLRTPRRQLGIRIGGRLHWRRQRWMTCRDWADLTTGGAQLNSYDHTLLAGVRDTVCGHLRLPVVNLGSR